MNIALTKNIFGPLNISESQFSGVFGPNSFNRTAALSDQDIRRRFEEPIGTPTIREMARGAKRVVIVTDDNTRPTPLPRLLSPILNHLEEAGVPKSGITLLVGLGTHRPMTSAEIKTKFGTYIISRYAIVNHAWDDAQSLLSLGLCEMGFEVVINKLVKGTDLLLCVGNIVPHATTGFSGGGKAIMPGICGEKTIENTHWKALDYSMAEILGNFENKIRESVVSVCKRVDLQAIINTVLFDGDKIYDLVMGDVELAHRQGAQSSIDVFGVSIPCQVDIVIAEAYPTDIDLRQAIKALCAADIVCRDGGVIILPAECPEGISPQFPEFEHRGFRDPDRLFEEVEAGHFSHKLMAYTLVAIGRIISKRVRAILVCPNISSEQAEAMGFCWAPDLQSAAEMALSMVRPAGTVAVLRSAGEILPFIQST